MQRYCLWLIVCLSAFGLFSKNTEVVPPFVEPWANTSAWNPMGSPCWITTNNHLNMHCQSAGLVSKQTWSKTLPITATVTVSATVAPNSSNDHYFAGLTLYDAGSNDTVYGELALSKLVPPFGYFTNHDSAGTMVNEFLTWRTDIVAGKPYTLTVSWIPNKYKFYLDGQYITESAVEIPAHDFSIFILCVSVGEATPDDGSSALCRFGPVTVVGTFSENVKQTYIPFASGSLQGYP